MRPASRVTGIPGSFTVSIELLPIDHGRGRVGEGAHHFSGIRNSRDRDSRFDPWNRYAFPDLFAGPKPFAVASPGDSRDRDSRR